MVRRGNSIYFSMTTLYLPTPGLFVDKPFCQNSLVKARGALRARGALGLDLVSVGIQGAPSPAISLLMGRRHRWEWEFDKACQNCQAAAAAFSFPSSSPGGGHPHGRRQSFEDKS